MQGTGTPVYVGVHVFPVVVATVVVAPVVVAPVVVAAAAVATAVVADDRRDLRGGRL